MKYLVLAPILWMTGCGGHYVTHVYGKSGADFTAPTVCAALVKCMNSSEVACYYDKSLLTTTSGVEEVGGCKEVKK